MRRSNLSSASRLSIQAAAGNSLKFSDVEQAMRTQEEELLHAERHRGHQGSSKPHKSFWVESEGHWGLMLGDVDEADSFPEEQIHWVEQDVFQEQFVGDSQNLEPETSWFSDGCFDWMWQDDEWYTATDIGWVAYSEMKPWLDIDEVSAQDPQAGKELQE